jgi:hypothetical protein
MTIPTETQKKDQKLPYFEVQLCWAQKHTAFFFSHSIFLSTTTNATGFDLSQSVGKLRATHNNNNPNNMQGRCMLDFNVD